MPSLGNLDWSSWVQGIMAGFIGGGSSAVVAGVAAKSIYPDLSRDGAWKAFEFMVVLFLFSGVINALMFLRQNPTPSPLKLQERAVNPE